MTEISKEEIDEILERYDKKRITIATICSHTALQIFFGAKQEGFKTLGICRPEMKRVYESFPLAKPDKFLLVDDYDEILSSSIHAKLIEDNVIIVPHGSFVEYIGSKNICNNLLLPIFGNRLVFEWESDRKKERNWLLSAGLRMPLEFKNPSDIDRLVIVKFHGAKGGKNYFLAKNEEEFHQGMEKVGANGKEYTIQEYVVGANLYFHYFNSVIENRIELLGMDKRYESNIEGIVRIPHLINKIKKDPSFVVVGNTPVIVRESLLQKILKIGEDVVKSSRDMFPKGLIGPFCIETVCTEDLEFVVFEISARIVAGTNLYMFGSPYSQLLYKEPMSTGRRISREIKTAIERGLLSSVVY